MEGGGGGDGQTQPLLEKLSNSPYCSSDEQIVKRTGTAWTAAAHIITAVIGSGVLSLAWSVAQLGWLGGPAAMVFFAGVTTIQSSLLADCYISHHPEHGVVRNRSYVDAVRFYLGEKSQWFCGFFLNFSLFGGCVVYTLTSATSMRQALDAVSSSTLNNHNNQKTDHHLVVIQSAIQKANCYHWKGHDAPCSVGGDGYYMLAFGLVQVVLSQIPGFHDMAWLSIFSAAMSFSYSLIGFGLGVAKVIANGVVEGGIGGIAMVSATQKAWRVSQALGDIAFAYPYSSVLLEIEDTLRSPPPENETMKTASRASILITTFFYLCCGCFGYAAFMRSRCSRWWSG
uniref:Amino acid transporter transmembrane domain-containing protein n=1 Tax=Leersia perrieri TaxID=77586 RepID=A0A0D9VKD6_9ORYZ